MSTAPNAVYVENRVWMLNSRLAVPRDDRQLLSSPAAPVSLKTVNSRIFPDDAYSVRVGFDCEPNRPRTADAYKLRLVIDFERPALQRVSERIREHVSNQIRYHVSPDIVEQRPVAPTWTLVRLHVLVYDVGQLNLRTMWVLALSEIKSLGKKIDDVWDRLSNAITQSLYEPLLVPLIKYLSEIGYTLADGRVIRPVKMLGTMDWGVPDFLRHPDNSDEDMPYRHSYEDTYTLTNHLFLHGNGAEAVAREAAEQLHCADDVDDFAGYNGAIGWATRIWTRQAPPDVHGDQDEALDKVLSLDTLFLMQVNVVTAGNSAYKALLDRVGRAELRPAVRGRVNIVQHWARSVVGVLRAGRGGRIRARRVRALMNVSNAQLLLLQFQEAEASEQHTKLLLRMRQLGELDAVVQRYRQAEDNVEHAVVGLEAEQIAKGTRIIEIILVLFGSLGLYSILSDLHQLVKENVATVAPGFAWISRAPQLLLVPVTVALASAMIIVLWASRRY